MSSSERECGQKPFDSSAFRRVRRNRWIMALAASPLLISIGVLVAAIQHPHILVGFLHPTIIGVVLIQLAYRKNYAPSFLPISLHASRDRLRLGTETLPQSDLRSGVILPARTGHLPKVILTRRFALPVELAIDDLAEGQRLLRALGFDATQTVATFRAQSRAASSPRHGVGAVLSAALLMGLAAATMVAAQTFSALLPLGLLLLAAAFIGLFAMLLGPTRVDVGADGIALRWLGTRRFIPYASLNRVVPIEPTRMRPNPAGIELELATGESVPISFGKRGFRDDELAILEERIREARSAYRADEPAHAEAMLERGGRPMRAWLRSLKGMGTGAQANVRIAPVPRDELFRVLENPAIAAAKRASAAIALSAGASAEDSSRLRAAAQAIAAPKLRIAVQKAADASPDDALAEALAELEADEPTKAHR